MKFRLGYDYVFLSKKPFTYKGDLIRGTSINVLFKVFDENKKELLFEAKEVNEQKLYFPNGESFYLCELFNCFFDLENIYKLYPSINCLRCLRESNYSIYFRVIEFTKDIEIEKMFISEPTFIDKDEFADIMQSNVENFDNLDNKPTQTTSYITKAVLDESKVVEWEMRGKYKMGFKNNDDEKLNELILMGKYDFDERVAEYVLHMRKKGFKF